MKIEQLGLKELKPYERNAKKHDERQIKNVMESIKQFGFAQPLVVDKDNVLIIGHCRLIAAKRLKLKTVPVLRMEELNEEQVQKLRLLDNKLNESEWDMDLLAEDIPALDFSDFDIDWDLPEEGAGTNEIKEDEVPPVPENPKAKAGDVYILGRHRLVCGDSTDEKTIEMLLAGEKADLVFTDPPYNLETTGGCKGAVGQALRKQGRDIDFIANFDPAKFLQLMPHVFNGNMNAYVFCNKDLLPQYLNWAVENKYSYNVLVWKKPNAIPIGDSHRPDIEYILLFRKNALWNNSLKEVNYSRCLEFSRETGLHPTMKPVKLIANELFISSNENSNVVDFFGGSGSTLIACEQTKRNCFMCELSPQYVDVIVKRYINLIGNDKEIYLLREGKKIPYAEFIEM